MLYFSFYLYPELMTDLIAFHNMYLYMMVAFSTGKIHEYMLFSRTVANLTIAHYSASLQ